jgi:predicted transcriptional regulator
MKLGEIGKQDVSDGMNSDLLMSRNVYGTKKNKFKNRSRMEIISNLLTKAKLGALKTHLMYGGNLSYPLVQEYLAILLESRLISKEIDDDDSSVRYRTTAKGIEFLDHYGAIVSLLGDQISIVTGSGQALSENRSRLIFEPIENPPHLAMS